MATVVRSAFPADSCPNLLVAALFNNSNWSSPASRSRYIFPQIPDHCARKKKSVYLPTRIGVPVIEKILFDPLVDGWQGHFVFVSFHGHTNERSVRIGRFDITDSLVIDLFLFFFDRRTGWWGGRWWSRRRRAFTYSISQIRHQTSRCQSTSAR